MQTKDLCVSQPSIINDYVEGELSHNQQEFFTDYLASDKQMENLVHLSKQGKQALNHAYRVVAADDFGEKLARRIAREEK